MVVACLKILMSKFQHTTLLASPDCSDRDLSVDDDDTSGKENSNQLCLDMDNDKTFI